jgi:hypothetical protein
LNPHLLNRRKELVQALVRGDALTNIIGDLSEKYHVSRNALYKDYQRRANWMPSILAIDNREAFYMDLLAIHQDIFRLYRIQYFSADNTSAAVGCLRLLRDLNMDLIDLITLLAS